MRKIALLLTISPIILLAQTPTLQNVSTRVNKFDKSVEISYMPAKHMMGLVPFFISTEILDGDTVHHAYFMQEIERDVFLRKQDGKAEDFEILTSSGISRITVEQLKKTVVKYDTGMFESGYSVTARMPMTKALWTKLFTANGFRINGLGEGSVFGDDKKAKIEFQAILTNFSNANPHLK